MKAKPSEIIDIEVCLHNETEKAVLVSADGLHGNAVWIPKAIVEIEKTGEDIWELSLPRNRATAEGLV